MGSSVALITPMFDDGVVDYSALENLIKSGQQWFGERFDYQNSQSFDFSFPNLEQNSQLTVKTEVVARSFTPSTFSLKANNTTLTTISVPNIVSISNWDNYVIIYDGALVSNDRVSLYKNGTFIEYIVGPDLEHLGYELSQPNGFQIQDWDWYKLYEKEYLNCKGWRTDNGSPEVDLGLEMLRHQLLQFKTNDRELIRRCFLFPEIYHSLLRKHR